MTQTYRTLLLALRLAVLLTPAPALAGELTVTLNRIQATTGSLMVAVHGSEAGFRGEAPAVMSLLLPPNGDSVQFSTNALLPGSYGVQVMHDRNGNGELDSNLVGMPTEAWGFSNNAIGSFGPPTWEAVRFEHSGQTHVTIDLNH